MLTNHKEGSVDHGALKNLREKRKETIARVAAIIKKQRKDIQALKALLREGEQTIPQLAEIMNLPSSEVFWYVAALKKYGEIFEGKKEGSYFFYRLADKAEEEE